MSEFKDIAGTEFDELLMQQMRFGRTRRSGLAYKSMTGHVGGTVGRRLGSSG